MKGVSAILATVMLIVVVVALVGIFMSFSTSLLRSTQTTVGNKTAEAIECSGASITIDDVFVTKGTSPVGSAKVRVVNNGLKNDLVIVSARLFNNTGHNFSVTALPIPNFDVGEVEVLSFSNIDVERCTNFSQVIVTTNCGIASDTFTKAPRCV